MDDNLQLVMIEELKSKLDALHSKKTSIKPKIDELLVKKEEELQDIENRYEQMISELNSEVEVFEKEIYNDLIQSFIEAVMKEFDAKRSMSEYNVTNEIKQYENFIQSVEFFPKDLIERLRKITDASEPIENLAYDVDKIKEKFSK